MTRSLILSTAVAAALGFGGSYALHSPINSGVQADRAALAISNSALPLPTPTTPAQATPVDYAPSDPLIEPAPINDPVAPTIVPIPAPVPGQTDEVSTFDQPLAQYGAWSDDPTYGRVWQPEVAVSDPNWRPYESNGHWTYTDRGWYFESSDPWSWAAYHYGRWTQDSRRGWMWVPGSDWAPSWVSWRESNDCYGWAPLPPEAQYSARAGFSFHGRHVEANFDFGLRPDHFTFVHAQDFLAHDVASVQVPRSRVTNIYNTSVTVNNTYVYNDNRIINKGIDVNAVARVTNQTIVAEPVVSQSVDSALADRNSAARALAAERQAARQQQAADRKVTQQSAQAARQATATAQAQARESAKAAQQQRAQEQKAAQQQQAQERQAATRAAQEQKQAQAAAQAAAQAKAREQSRTAQQQQAAQREAAQRAVQQEKQAQAAAQTQVRESAKAAQQQRAQEQKAAQQQQAQERQAAARAAQEQRQAQAAAQAQSRENAKAAQQQKAQEAKAAQQERAQEQRAAKQQKTGNGNTVAQNR